MDIAKFETLTPSIFTTFTIENSGICSGSTLRIAVLDSPDSEAIDPPQVAGMIVPAGRESDWIFSTESGHLQLLRSSLGISRLVLFGKVPEPNDDSHIVYNRSDEYGFVVSEETLVPLLVALSPKASFVNGFVDVPFLRYDDDLIGSVILVKRVGPFVGEMLVEDVEIEVKVDGGSERGCVEGLRKRREFRRRLRFRRTPNLVQTEIQIVPCRDVGLEEGLGVADLQFQLDSSVLVHPYLGPMAACLTLISDCLEEKMRTGIRPRALCLGVGGGALLGFLKIQLGFKVVGVEADEVVLRISKDYFGMVEDKHMQLRVGDGIKVLKMFRCICKNSFGVHDAEGRGCCDSCVCKDKFDVIMVDLDTDDPMNGLVAPPLAFLQRSVLTNVKLALQKTGILVVNVIPPDDGYYNSLISDFQEVFTDLYEIDVGNGENFVLIASVSPLDSFSGSNDSYIMKKLKQTNLGHYAEHIKKI